jgi:hypothetical protein
MRLRSAASGWQVIEGTASEVVDLAERRAVVERDGGPGDC